MTTKKLVIIALLIAMDIILTRFLSIQLPIIRIGFGFLPVAICAMLFGPLTAGLAAALADFIGVSLFAPFAPFPGFTLSAFLTGFAYGLFLHKQPNFVKILLAVLIVTIPIQLFIDTVWVYMLFGGSYNAHFLARLPRSIVMIPIQFVIIKNMLNVLPQIKQLRLES